MFRWLLKPSLSDVKLMKTRLEIIQRKNKAVQKFTKSDIAELLRSGLDYDAYKRAERLLFEQNLLCCYELIEKFVACISDHVEDLTKRKDCPDECKEAVPSLIYAAARFADLPELRDLRTLFNEKFGNSLEPYINKEFVEKLRRDPPTREMKIRLLNDIAQEFSIEWDDKALRQSLYTQSSLCEEEANSRGDSNTSKGKERGTLTVAGGRKDLNDESWIHQSSSDDETSTSQDDGKGSSSSSLGSISEDEVETKRPISYRLIPPPYLKAKTNKGESNSKKKTTHCDAATLDSGKEHDTEQNRRHVRGKSLPSEPTTDVEASKGHTRTISLETGMHGGAWRTRLEIIQKYKKAEQKIMKSDLVELLRSGLDYDAYKRAGRLLLEQNMLSCYKLIEEFVGCISDHVEDLTKQTGCPDECKEAVPSLIYAAARFGDLPALIYLRTLFTKKFDISLLPDINKEFVEKLRQDPPTTAMKIRLLNDIAQEFSIEWDDKALRRSLYTQSSLCEEQEKPNPGRECNTSKAKERDTLNVPRGREDLNDEPWIHQSSSEDESSIHQSSSDDETSSLGSLSEDEIETKRPDSYRLIQPPYLKPKTNKGESNPKKTTHCDAATLDSGKEHDTGQNRRRASHDSKHIVVKLS
ncbi:IST1-like protein, partial [Mucuna pruriens]